MDLPSNSLNNELGLWALVFGPHSLGIGLQGLPFCQSQKSKAKSLKPKAQNQKPKAIKPKH